MKFAFLFAVATLVATPCSSSAFAQSPRLMTVSAQDDQLRTIDPSTGATIASVQMMIPGQPQILQAHGCAVDPTTEAVYAVVSLVALATKNLLRVDPDTGICVDVGDTGEKFAGIAFDSSGQLWGISGDGGLQPESLFKIDKNTAASTFVLALGGGGPGEALGFNPFDGKLYHGSGNGVPNDPIAGTIYETIDPVTLQVTNIPLQTANLIGIQSLTRLNASAMIFTDFGLALMHLSTGGAITTLGTMDHLAKGFAWVSGPSFFASYGSGCPGSGGFTPQLIGSGVPNPAETATMAINQALGGAPCVLFVGLGTGTANLNPSCALHVMPIVPSLAVNLPMIGVGPGGGGIALPFTVPANVTPFDLYLQALVGDPGGNGGIASSKPMRLHLQ